MAFIAWRNFFGALGSVEKYELLLSILQRAIDIFVPWRRVKNALLPTYLESMSNHRVCLFMEARRTQDEEDWEMYKTFAKKFEKALAKRNHSIEKKIVESK